MFSAYKEQRFRDLAENRLADLVTPGLTELMGWMDRTGMRSAAVTNAPRANAELMLRSIGRLEWFNALVIGEECSAAKPNPGRLQSIHQIVGRVTQCLINAILTEPYLVAMRKLGVEPFQCIAIEDSPSGAAAAVAAGV